MPTARSSTAAFKPRIPRIHPWEYVNSVVNNLDGTEHIYIPEYGDIPEEVSYVEYLGEPFSQKMDPICVACCICGYLNWAMRVSGRDTKCSIEDAFEFHKKVGGGPRNGIYIKNALSYLKNNGFDISGENVRIKEYLLVGEKDLKSAIYFNGPCITSLPIYNYRADTPFWVKTSKAFYGRHAVLIAGYGKDGYMIRNSWGSDFRDNGNILFPYGDFKFFDNIWTLKSN